MKCNVGGIDRVLRIVVGLVLVGLAASNEVGVWGWIGIIPLATGLLSSARYIQCFALIHVEQVVVGAVAVSKRA